MKSQSSDQHKFVIDENKNKNENFEWIACPLLSSARWDRDSGFCKLNSNSKPLKDLSKQKIMFLFDPKVQLGFLHIWSGVVAVVRESSAILMAFMCTSLACNFFQLSVFKRIFCRGWVSRKNVANCVSIQFFRHFNISSGFESRNLFFRCYILLKMHSYSSSAASIDSHLLLAKNSQKLSCSTKVFIHQASLGFVFTETLVFKQSIQQNHNSSFGSQAWNFLFQVSRSNL